MPNRPFITLTTDFGYNDAFVGVMKGAIFSINPDAEIVDLCHGIRPQDTKEAAFTIGTNFRYFPFNTIHIVVVDPGVGSLRRPIMVSTEHHYFIGPDNGVFSHIYNTSKETPEVLHITASHYFLSSHSPTFHGRDVFAPVAAWLSRGVVMSKFGDPVTDYKKIDLPFSEKTAKDGLRGEVIHVDRYGNSITNITKSDIEGLIGTAPIDGFRILLKGNEVFFKQFYSQADEGKLCSLINSNDFLEFFINRGDASAEYKIAPGDVVEIDVREKPV